MSSAPTSAPAASPATESRATKDGQEWHPSACILCECNCGIEVRLDGREITRVRGDKAHPRSLGYACEKALRLNHYQNGRHRLTTPMRRRPDGTHEPIDWDTAIKEVAERLAAVRDNFGGESIFFYGGGGQANHLTPGGISTQRALGGRYMSNALAQEKTGEFWIDAHLYGGHTAGDFENTQVAVFVGKNPWQSHGVTRARTVLKEIARDPERSIIVIDPRRSETADLADIHLQVKPGTDAWCLAALLGVVVQEHLVDQAFLDEHAVGAEEAMAPFRDIPVDEYAAYAGLDPADVRKAARLIGAAESAAFYEDLGIQQSPQSTLSSYIEKLIWLTTGNFAKRGGVNLHSYLVNLARGGAERGKSPVAGARMISGLVPCNVITEEILTDHPNRYRAMIIESANPVSSLAATREWREALDSLDTVVVIDVAMTETARHADYVLPAASQFEKWEASFFNLDFPDNVFHLREPLFDPLPGTLPEPEIHSRIIRALGVVPDEERQTLAEALEQGREVFALTFMRTLGARPEVAAAAPILLYDILGPTLADGAAPAAPLWALAHKAAMKFPAPIRRAGFEQEGFALGEALFDAFLTSRHGVLFSRDEYEHCWDYVAHDDRKVHLAIPELLGMVGDLAGGPQPYTSDEFPFVLAAGERRSFTANAIYRDPAWRRKDVNGALRISPKDAADLGVDTGDSVRVVTAGGEAEATVEVTDRMQSGHMSLPNGFGLVSESDTGDRTVTGVPANELTTTSHRDPIAGTPFHKHTPARVELLTQAG